MLDIDVEKIIDSLHKTPVDPEESLESPVSNTQAEVPIDPVVVLEKENVGFQSYSYATLQTNALK